MTIDAAEIARLREQLLADKVPGLPACWNLLMRALLAELEKARAEVDNLKLERQAVADLSVTSQICFDRVVAQRDSARELLREAQDRMTFFNPLHARIAAELGDKP